MSEMSGSTKAVGIAVFVAGLIATLLIMGVWGGFVLMNLWNWFAAPVAGVVLSLPAAVGFSCLLSYIRGVRYQADDKEDTGAKILFSFTGPGVLLLVGYIAHLFAK